MRKASSGSIWFCIVMFLLCFLLEIVRWRSLAILKKLKIVQDVYDFIVLLSWLFHLFSHIASILSNNILLGFNFVCFFAVLRESTCVPVLMWSRGCPGGGRRCCHNDVGSECRGPLFGCMWRSSPSAPAQLLSGHGHLVHLAQFLLLVSVGSLLCVSTSQCCHIFFFDRKERSWFSSQAGTTSALSMTCSWLSRCSDQVHTQSNTPMWCAYRFL